MMNKKGLQFKRGIFALIISSVLILAVGAWINEWDATYDSGLNYDLGKFSKLNETATTAKVYKGNVTAQSSFDEGDFEGTSFRGAFAVINTIFDAFDVMFNEGGLISLLKDRWGVPNYIMTGIIALMIIAIVMAIIAIFFRKPGGST